MQELTAIPAIQQATGCSESRLPPPRKRALTNFLRIARRSWYSQTVPKSSPRRDRTHYPRLLLHNEPAVLRLPQMPQLRGNARRRVVRQFRQLVQRQPRLALPRAQHHVAKHVALPPPRDPFQSPFPSFPHLRLLSRRVSVLGRKLFCASASCTRALVIFSIVRRPRRAVRVFIIPRAGAASAHLNRPASVISRAGLALLFPLISSSVIRAPTFSTFFHSVFTCKYYLPYLTYC